MKRKKRRIKRRMVAKRGRPRRALTITPSRFKIAPMGRMRGILADSITLRTVDGETYVEVNGASAASSARGKGCRILYEPGDQSVACVGSCPCPILVKRRRGSITFSCGSCDAETLPGDLGGAEWESL